MNLPKLICLLSLLVSNQINAQASADFLWVDNRGNIDGVVLREATLFYSGDSIAAIYFEVTDIEKVDSLKPGEYTVKYVSFFGDSVVQEFEISENKEYEIELDAFYLNPERLKTPIFLDELISGDTLRIDIASNGCYFSYSRFIEISKMERDYFLSYNGQVIQLTPEQLEIIRTFEIQLRNLKNPLLYCTSKDKYKLTLGGKIYTTIDGSCTWLGIQYLAKNLGLER